MNDADQSWTVSLRMSGLEKNLAMLKSTADASPEKTLRYETINIHDGMADLTLPPFSLVILTDTPMAKDAPGRW